MSFDEQVFPINEPIAPVPLVRGVTIYGSVVCKPCTNCGHIVSSDNVGACTRYTGGKMLCSDNCRGEYITRHGSLPQ